MEDVHKCHEELLDLITVFKRCKNRYNLVQKELQSKIDVIIRDHGNYEPDLNNGGLPYVCLKAESAKSYKILQEEQEAKTKEFEEKTKEYLERYDDIMRAKLEAWSHVSRCDLRGTIDYFLGKASKQCVDQWVASAPNLDELGY